MAEEYRTLAEATAFALTRGGTSVMDNPHQFLSYLADVMDPDGAEMRVLMRLCNNELLEPYRAAIGKGIDELRTAESRARDYLTSECMIEPNTAASVTMGIANGMAHRLGLTGAARRVQSQPVSQSQSQPQPAPQPQQQRRGNSWGSAAATARNQTAAVTPSPSGSSNTTTRRSPSQGTAPASKPKTDITAAIPEPIRPQAFTGKPLEPKLRLTLNGTLLTYGRDYRLHYHGNVGSQTREAEATVTAVGTGSYFGSVTSTFKIVPPSKSGSSGGAAPAANKPKVDISDAKVDPIAPQAFTGKPLQPRPVVRVKGTVLTYGKDYLLTYHGNVGSQTHESEASIMVTGTGDYVGSKDVTFKILTKGQAVQPAAPAHAAKSTPAPASVAPQAGASATSITAAKVSTIATQRYTGKPIEPKPYVSIGGKQLVYGKDYQISYLDNLGDSASPSVARAVIIGMGPYSGRQTVTFTIHPTQGETASPTPSFFGCLFTVIGGFMMPTGLMMLLAGLSNPSSEGDVTGVGFVTTIIGLTLLLLFGRRAKSSMK